MNSTPAYLLGCLVGLATLLFPTSTLAAPATATAPATAPDPAGNIELPDILSDRMVLQRGRAVPIWGRATPGRDIMVKFRGSDYQMQVDPQGRWRLEIETGQASADGHTLGVIELEQITRRFDGQTDTHVTVQRAEVELNDVLVGEVWHCSGQSNMRWPVSRSLNPEAEIAAGDHPRIRLFNHPRVSAAEPRFTAGGAWQACSPQTVGSFSAVGYFFGRKLHEDLEVPSGLVATPGGGAAAEAYISAEALAVLPSGRSYLDRYGRSKVEAAVARARGRELDEGDEAWHRTRPQSSPSLIFNGMIHPVAPFAKRGVIWYQGESNAARADSYDALLRNLIDDWRALWDQTGAHHNFPFLMVQLANFRAPVTDPHEEGWGPIRQAQFDTAENHPNAYLATAIDIGEADDIHPRNKQEVGRRLALIALRRVYGFDGFMDQGPTFANMRPTSPDEHGHERMRLSFDYASGLTTRDGDPPRGLAVRPADGGEWRWAVMSTIRDGDLLVSAPAGIEAPFDVRYAWGMNPTQGPHGANLVNGEGLPMFPFEAIAD